MADLHNKCADDDAIQWEGDLMLCVNAGTSPASRVEDE